MDAALLWLLIAASRGGVMRRNCEVDDAAAPQRASAAPLRRRLRTRSAWLRALEEIGLVDRRMKPSPIRKLW